jgi:hypothetical protein
LSHGAEKGAYLRAADRPAWCVTLALHDCAGTGRVYADEIYAPVTRPASMLKAEAMHRQHVACGDLELLGMHGQEASELLSVLSSARRCLLMVSLPASEG